MTPAQFIKKWSDSRLRERQGSQEHFIDLCRLLGEPTPAEDDPNGDRYCFERGAAKTGGGDGWADVWRKHCFGWEYKGKHKNLDAALRQLQAYALDLENPPYLIVSDMERIIVHTNWTNTISRKIEFTLDDLHEPEKLAVLRLVFEGSESLRPKISPQELTAKVAQRFGDLGRRLQERGHDPRAVAHFLNRIVFCMFAEDAKLLPEGLFTRMTRSMQLRPPAEAAVQFDALFSMMRTGGLFGADVIRWFNGGLFDDKPALPLERPDIKLICDTAGEHDWSELDPSVFGNMFEEALKATRERAALGAHYTDRAKILKIIDPVITWPLMAEWEAALSEIRAAMEARAATEVERKAVLEAAAEAMRQDSDKAKAGEAGRRKALTAIAKRADAALGQAKDRLEAFLSRLAAYRVLDPACGSGNFLYVALHALKDIERRALVDAARLGIEVPTPRVGLECVRGIEIEDYAAELARVTLWIGDLQWNAKNNYTGLAEPILSSLDQIECRDALLNADGTEAEWPEADAIVGNPPFLGASKFLRSLGEDYVDRLRRTYLGRVPGNVDFVSYWFEKASREIISGKSNDAGFIATNTIRQSTHSSILDQANKSGGIFNAWIDERWINDGASLSVVFVSFGKNAGPKMLSGRSVYSINSDLTAIGGEGEVHSESPQQLIENHRCSFQGSQKIGSFDIDGSVAREWLSDHNPNSKSNRDVLSPLWNGMDVTRRVRDMWAIDFGVKMSEEEASLYEKPFEYALSFVKPERLVNNRESYRKYWWRHGEPRIAMRAAMVGKSRVAATSEKSKHHFFVWIPAGVLPDKRLIVVTSDDDAMFGMLSSKYHSLWSRRYGSTLEDRPCYTPSTTFETFPFPEGLTPNIPAADYAADPRAIAIGEAAADLNAKREAWLNPADLVRIEPEVVAGYPDRILPVSPEAAVELKKRTLTNLYNQRPAWLDMAHKRLDAAVAAAYGWPGDLSGDEVLERLFALNQERAAAGR